MIDIDSYLLLLDKNTHEVISLVRDLDDRAVRYKNFNAWSVLEVLEHMMITERFVHGLLLRPASKQADKAELHGAERLNRMLVDMRERKVKAPDMLEPKGEFENIQSFLPKFRELRSKFAADIKEGRLVIDQRVHSHPMLGEMTVSDWLHFVLSHARRHMEQIRDILKVAEGSE